MATNPYVNKVVYGNQTVMDISDSDVQEGDVVSGKTFYKADGSRSEGTADYYSPSDTAETTIDDADYFPYYDTSATAKRKSTWSNIVAKIKSAIGISSGSTYLKKDGTWGTPTDTKNTAGSTDTSDKIYLVGAKSQAANPQTYSDNEVFAQDGVLSSKKLSSKCITALTGTGTAGEDKGSGSTNRYVPALWTFDSGITVADGEVYFIKIPVVGGTWGVYLSLNNGTNYYPVAISNGKGRFTTHYGQNMVIGVTYESAGVCNCYAKTGADTLADVTGCFRVFDSYDSNTTYSAMSSSELTTGTATTLRTVRADYLKTGVNSLIDTKINALDVTGASNIAASKTIKAWSETDGKVSVTTQNISITKSQVSDFPTLATVATTGSYDDLVDEPAVEIAAKGGTIRSLVTTGEKWNWNNSEALHAIQTLAGWDVTAGETLRFPTTGTDDRITSSSKLVPFATAINGRPVKYSSIQAYSGYATVTVAESATNITFTLYVVKPISAHDDN